MVYYSISPSPAPLRGHGFGCFLSFQAQTDDGLIPSVVGSRWGRALSAKGEPGQGGKDREQNRAKVYHAVNRDL